MQINLNHNEEEQAESILGIVRFLSNFTPLTHVVEAMRCIVSRGM
jgi:hypothetical protein